MTSVPEGVTFDPADRDPRRVRPILRAMQLAMKIYHRAEMRGMERVPDEPSLIVSNHSGSPSGIDFPVFASHHADRFGTERPLHLLAADVMTKGPIGRMLRQVGIIPASRANAAYALSIGSDVMVFPGGDYDATRPTSQRNRIDFAGRTGYVTIAKEAGVPIVPVVAIGAQETHLYLTRGEWLARALRFDRLARVKALPIQFGVPFGFSIGGILPLNVPLPSKVVAEVLEPILPEEIADLDVEAVDELVRSRMQAGLDALARERRFPVIG